jgi:TolB protein
VTRTRALVVAVAVLTSAVAIPAVLVSRASATFSGTNGRIAFQGCSDSGCDIYTANADGTAVRRVTENGSSIFPDWSPDGKRIAYSSWVSGATAIWIADADGRNARQLTPDEEDASNVWPRFTPDGKSVVYTNCLGDDCDGGISAINVDGTGQRAITPNSGDSYNVGTPSPDGKTLVFMRWHFDGVHMRLYQRAIDDPHEVPLTPPELEAWAPDWSPDGGTIVFSSNVFANRPNGAIYSLELKSGAIQQLTRPPFPLEDWSPSYSPDGSRVVFTSNRLHPARDGSGLFTMRADGSHLEAVELRAPAQGLFVEWPRWSAAGRTTVKAAVSRNAAAASARHLARPPRSLCTIAHLRLCAHLATWDSHG